MLKDVHSSWKRYEVLEIPNKQQEDTYTYRLIGGGTDSHTGLDTLSLFMLQCLNTLRSCVNPFPSHCTVDTECSTCVYLAGSMHIYTNIYRLCFYVKLPINSLAMVSQINPLKRFYMEGCIM